MQLLQIERDEVFHHVLAVTGLQIFPSRLYH
jgi:hypothetical protein